MSGGRYGVYYRGVLAASHLTMSGAKGKAWTLVKERGWEIDEVKILPIVPVPQIIVK